MRIGFLFNHSGGHQVAHALPIALALKAMSNVADVELFVAPGDVEGEVRRSLAAHSGMAPRLTLLGNPAPAWRVLQRASGDALPIDRLSVLHRNLPSIRKLDVIVTPEKTSLMLKSVFGLNHLKFIWTGHGAGDRAIGFDKASGRFDFVLLSGPKLRDRLAQAGCLREGGYAIVGYPKFDAHLDKPSKRLFENDRPTVIYQPHPSPALSSWYRMGRHVLRYFAWSGRYNLVFAPHVMLFRKKLSVGLSPFGVGWTGQPPRDLNGLSHILLDTQSPALLDMTYTDAADIYIGDASSQVYEFIRKPRPCIFLNPTQRSWRNDANFAHWGAGPVVSSIEQLDKALDNALAAPDAFEEAQRCLFSYSFDLNGRPSSERAASAILQFLGLR